MKTKSIYTLVTGATSRIGYELALLFAKNGHNLILVSHDLKKVQSKSAELRDYGIDVRAFQADLFDPRYAFSLCERIDELDLVVDVLVNILSQDLYGQFKDTDIRDELDIVQRNVSSMLILNKYFFGKMVARKSGKIVHVTSTTSEETFPRHAVYQGTRAFVSSFSQALREEAREHGVVVTTLLEGLTEREFIDRLDMKQPNSIQDEISIVASKALVNSDDDTRMVKKH